MVLTVFIDLKKAFDSCSHSIIVAKLKCLGIEDTELRWFENYLTGHKQYVELENCRSGMTNVCVGVPQGSLLRVLFFQLIINDLHRCLKFATSILYANDTTLILSGNSLRFLKVKMQSDLNRLSAWLRVNYLKLNVLKTKSMLFHKDGTAN